MNGVFFGQANPGQTYFRDDFVATDRVRLYNEQAALFLQDASLNTDWLVNAYLTFTYTGGITVAVTAILDAER